ncbi:MAG: D-alanyl-D-alanine carboxypeptidase [Rhodospirillaceae bacterium]|nr:D-alanyl-D-alanine carboxypeptidase [Rhodospirillaceae bacterium]|tara:strand:- start:7437 stop:8579 length:1143 start_codon:yes stop_codon:yes gene_type:complete
MTARILLVAIVLFVLVAVSGQARAFDTTAREAILIEVETGTVLLEKNSQEITFPSSMTKLMTIYLLFERLAEGSLSLTDTLPVSEKAWRMGGSKMFVEVDTDVTVEDLIRGIVVQSGNDATIVVAEGLAGSEDAFARLMTDKAREMGIMATSFQNASGWPDPNHVTTVADLAILAQRLIEDFPQYYGYYSETEFTFSDITQSNRNPLLYAGIGADGLKTGYTEAAGYGLAASATEGDRRLILVVNGFDSSQARASESQRILEWGFREFDTYDLFAAGEPVSEAEVWLGNSADLPLVLAEDLEVTLSREARRDMVVKVVYDGPIPAPIVEGAPIASLVIELPDMEPVERTLLAGADVGELSFFSRLGESIGYLIFGPPSTP